MYDIVDMLTDIYAYYDTRFELKHEYHVTCRSDAFTAGISDLMSRTLDGKPFQVFLLSFLLHRPWTVRHGSGQSFRSLFLSWLCLWQRDWLTLL